MAICFVVSRVVAVTLGLDLSLLSGILLASKTVVCFVGWLDDLLLRYHNSALLLRYNHLRLNKLFLTVKSGCWAG